ncbi:MAG: YkvA family protein [Alphaproteobacteria bacterium]
MGRSEENGEGGSADRPRLGDLTDPRVNLPATVERNERIVRNGFWTKLRRLMGRIPFAEDLVAAYVCAFDPATSWRVKAILLTALAYFVLPIDFLPDIIPGLGFTDDAAVLATALKMGADAITPAHRSRAREMLGRGPDGDDRGMGDQAVR